MSTITLQNFRVGSDLTVRVRLKDGGVAIDWSTLTNIRAHIYSDAQRALAGRCSVSIDEEDSTILVCQYAANKMQYLGVNRVIVQCKYMGEVKTYDKPAFNFVRWTSDQEGEQITIDDPDVDVEISVEDVSSSILQEAVDAAFDAADRANDAAAAAEHMVDIHTGPEGKSAYEVAVEEGYTGTEEEWLLSLQGKSAYEIAVELGYEGTEEQWLASLKGEDGEPGTTPHIGQNGDWFIGDTDTGVPASGANGVTPHIGSNGNWYIGDYDTEVPATGPAGQDGSPGITAEDVEDIQDIEATLAAVALKKTQQTLTAEEKAQVWENLGIDGISGKADKILIADSVPVGGMRPNTFYNLGTLTGSVSIEFSAAPDNTIYNEWMFQFETGSAAPTITWPAAITSWLGGSAPTINAYKKYQVSVVNGLAVIGDF